MRATNPLIHYNYFCKKLPVPDVEILKRAFVLKTYREVTVTYPQLRQTTGLFFLI
jgi:hypothetical protein